MHKIRLRKPWQRRVGNDGPPVTVDVPDTLPLLPSFPSPSGGDTAEPRIRYERRFNRPTGITEQTVVDLRIDGWNGILDSVTVNGNALPCPADATVASTRWDITEHLLPSNEFVVTLIPPPGVDQTPCLSGSVGLEIHETA